LNVIRLDPTELALAAAHQAIRIAHLECELAAASKALSELRTKLEDAQKDAPRPVEGTA
jgi:lipopolysaccharide biosynthesis regulator YciM